MPRLSQLFNRKDIHPVVLDVALFETFGPEWLTWDADSVFLALEKKFGAPVSRANKQKIYALGVFHSNHAYWEDWRAFEAMSWAFSGKQVDLVQATPLTPTVLMYGYRTARLLDSSSQFSDEVAAYIAGVFIDDQNSLLPPDLSFLQDKVHATKPQTQERSGMVKAALLSSAASSDMSEPDVDPVRVEVTRHNVLNTVLGIICTPKFVQTQANTFGVGSLVSRVLQGSKS